MNASNTYGKTEKLKSRKRIEALFARGRSFSVFPLKVFFVITADANTHEVQAGVGVSARNFKKAVQRNRIKRLLREAYRLQKATLYEEAAARRKTVNLFLLYIGREMPEHSLITEKMHAALKKLANELKQ